MIPDDRLPPHDVEAEEAVIGSLLINADFMAEVSMILRPSDFFITDCEWIFGACKSIYENQGNIDQITVAHELSRRGKLEEIGGTSRLSQLIAQTPSAMFAGDYAKIIRDCSINRNLIMAAGKISALGFENNNPQKSISEAQSLLQKIEYNQDEPSSASELSNLAADHYGTLRLVSGGMSTGLASLDNHLGGLLPGESIILCGNTSIGKTSLAIQIARNMSRDRRVFIASEEMTRQDIINKMVAQISGVHSELIALGNYPDDRLDRMVLALGTISTLKFRVARIKTTAMLRSAIDKYEPEFVIVDYLQKLRDKPNEKEAQRIGFIAHELTGIAKDFKIPLLVLSQLHRDMEEKKNKKPRLSDLRGSGEIEEAFDGVWGLWRESYTAFLNNKEPEGDTTELWVLKNRLRGNRGKVILEWDKNYECYKN